MKKVSSTWRDAIFKGPVCCISLISVLAPSPSFAAEYPAKTITIINPNAPGGGHDAVARAFATVAEKVLGQPVVVVNKAGASTMIGMTAVAQAAPDGYTLGMDSTTTTNALAWEIANGRKPPLTRDDLRPVGGLTVNVPLVIISYNSPWRTMVDMVRDLKAKPGILRLLLRRALRGDPSARRGPAAGDGDEGPPRPPQGGRLLPRRRRRRARPFRESVGRLVDSARPGEKSEDSRRPGRRTDEVHSGRADDEGGGGRCGVDPVAGDIGSPEDTGNARRQVRAVVKKVAEDPAFSKMLESQGEGACAGDGGEPPQGPRDPANGRIRFAAQEQIKAKAGQHGHAQGVGVDPSKRRVQLPVARNQIVEHRVQRRAEREEQREYRQDGEAGCREVGGCGRRRDCLPVEKLAAGDQRVRPGSFRVE